METIWSDKYNSYIEINSNGDFVRLISTDELEAKEFSDVEIWDCEFDDKTSND